MQHLLDQINELQAILEESHQEEIEHNHHGDPAHTCSYCKAILKAQATLLSHRVNPLTYHTME